MDASYITRATEDEETESEEAKGTERTGGSTEETEITETKRNQVGFEAAAWGN
jgi:hypothetical protein